MVHPRSWCVLAWVLLVSCTRPVPPSAHPAPEPEPLVAVRDAGPVAVVEPPAPDATAPQPVPEPDEPQCDEITGPKNPACKNRCWPGAMRTCDEKCPSPPDPSIQACQAIMPCPVPPDPRVRACPSGASVQLPFVARVIATNLTTNAVVLTIAAGRRDGIDLHLHATLLAGDSDTPLEHGAVDLLRVDEHITVGKVHLTPDQLRNVARVRFSRE